jgi:hypothetical protein
MRRAAFEAGVADTGIALDRKLPARRRAMKRRKGDTLRMIEDGL